MKFKLLIYHLLKSDAKKASFILQRNLSYLQILILLNVYMYNYIEYNYT